jgi:hypothetical protein
MPTSDPINIGQRCACPYAYGVTRNGQSELMLRYCEPKSVQSEGNYFGFASSSDLSSSSFVASPMGFTSRTTL